VRWLTCALEGKKWVDHLQLGLLMLILKKVRKMKRYILFACDAYYKEHG